MAEQSQIDIRFNAEILQKLADFNIDKTDEALLYLLGVYYGCTTEDVISDEVMKQVNLTKIVERIYIPGGGVVWNIPLFTTSVIEKPEEYWEWIMKWRDMFFEVRADCIGDSKACTDKMKKLFSKRPDIRPEEIIESTKLYLNEFRSGNQSIKFMQRADHYISKTELEGGSRIIKSRLLMYLEVYRKQRLETVGNQRMMKGVVK